jgi:hypothetical protein
LIFSIDDFFASSDISTAVQASRVTGRRSFALDYTIDIPNQSFHLGTDSHLNITPPAILPFVSSPFDTRAKAGDQDGINLPWFSYADATLLFGQSDIHGQDTAILSLRARWTESGRFELWPDSHYWTNDSSKTPALSPLLSLENYRKNNHAQFHAILPAETPSFSPSYTYPVRVMILRILKPTGLMLGEFLGVLGSIGSVIWNLVTLVAQWLILYMVVVVVVWCIRGRPPFREFFATSLLTKFIYTALVSNGEQRSSSVDLVDVDDDNVQPTPLTSIWDFFRSTSPLDDLFVTFTVTRPLTQPLLHRSQSHSIVPESAIDMSDKGDPDLEAGVKTEK